MTDAPRVIAIDGPAGSGKSTVARAVAERVGLPYLDTGAMYRSVAFAALRQAVDPEDVEVVGNLAEGLALSVEPDGTVVVDGVDATIEIRGPEVTRAVSIVAANPRVRAELRRRQREWATERGGGVMEGRDIGTVVFPDADLKVFLFADATIRAARRYEELFQKGLEKPVGEVLADQNKRDKEDSEREVAPLKPAADAIQLDSTHLPLSEVVHRIEGLIATRRP